MRDGVESLCNEVIDGKFRVICPIGQGGMGLVWRVQHLRTKQQFALKTLHGSAVVGRKILARVLHEARATAAVQSKHVVRIVDVNPDYEHRNIELPFILMELLEGASLSNLLELRSTLSASELIWIMRQVSRGLTAAHERGIIHCDLKPSNVFLSKDEDGEVLVKLCDFGIARLQGAARIEFGEMTSLSTETGVMFGTPRYMAPEQLRRHGKVGPATDQWAFAQLAFRALCGRNYFENARKGAELVLAIAHDPLPLPSTLSQKLPTAFDEWFMRSCARDPTDRYPDVTRQQAELEQALGCPAPTSVPLCQAKLCTPVSADAQFVATLAASVVERVVGRAAPRHAWVNGFVLTAAAAFAAIGTWQLPQILPRAPELAKFGTPMRAASVPAQTVLETSSVSTAEVSAEVPSVIPGAGTAPLRSAAERAVTTRQKASRRSAVAFSASARPATRLLARGATCTRSSQCADGLCAAEVCQ